MVKFLFSVHTITEAKQSNSQGGARAVDLPARSNAPRCSTATVYFAQNNNRKKK